MHYVNRSALHELPQLGEARPGVSPQGVPRGVGPWGYHLIHISDSTTPYSELSASRNVRFLYYLICHCVIRVSYCENS